MPMSGEGPSRLLRSVGLRRCVLPPRFGRAEPAAFFSRGTSGQWHDLLNHADLARYAARVRALASDDLVDWVHREAIG